MSFILVTEEFEGRQDWVWRSLSQCTQCRGADGLGQSFQIVDILHGAFAFGDPGQDLEHSLGTDTAWWALTAGFILSKL